MVLAKNYILFNYIINNYFIVYYIEAFTFKNILNNNINVIGKRTISNASPRNLEVGDLGSLNFPKELTKHELLSAVDEIALAKQYKLSVHVKAQREVMSVEFGRPATEEELAKSLEISLDHLSLIQNKGDDAKIILVQANMRLIFHIARFYRFRGVSYPDLVQEGTFGLMKAIDKYDPDRGFRFSTYASWWIKQAVSRAIAEKSRIVRLPVHIHDLMLSVSRAEKAFSMQHMRKPNAQELAEQLALPLTKVELLMKCSREVNSIDESAYQSRGKMQSNNEIQVKDRLISQTAEPTFINEKNSLRTELRRAMEHLSEREAQIIEMRFGLYDGNEMTLEEIGRRFNVTRERIRQIEARALSKLRQPFKQTDFKNVFDDQNLIEPEISSIAETLVDISL